MVKVRPTFGQNLVADAAEFSLEVAKERVDRLGEGGGGVGTAWVLWGRGSGGVFVGLCWYLVLVVGQG